MGLSLVFLLVVVGFAYAGPSLFSIDKSSDRASNYTASEIETLKEIGIEDYSVPYNNTNLDYYEFCFETDYNLPCFKKKNYYDTCPSQVTLISDTGEPYKSECLEIVKAYFTNDEITNMIEIDEVAWFKRFANVTEYLKTELVTVPISEIEVNLSG